MQTTSRSISLMLIAHGNRKHYDIGNSISGLWSNKIKFEPNPRPNILGTAVLKLQRQHFNAAGILPRPGATGGHPGAVPPKRKLSPPKRGLCPEEISRLAGCWSANRSPNLCLPLVFLYILWTKTGFHDIFGMKTFFFIFLFFWRSPVFGRRNRLNSRFRLINPSQLH